MLMTHHRNSDGLDPRAQAEHGRLALNVFAELTHQGGTNAVADAEGIALVVPDLIDCLLHLLATEHLPTGPAISSALTWYNAERGEEDEGLPDPIGLLRTIYQFAKLERTGTDHDDRVDVITQCLRDHGWTDDGSPFEP